MSVEIPKMAIAFGQYGIPQGDVIECRVHLGCTKEVSSFELLLQNWNGKYSPNGSIPLTVGMDGHIDIGRGANVPQIITCRIESIKHESTPTEHYTRVSGRCWGERLFRRVVTKTYVNMKGEAIVKDLLDYYVGLSHNRGGMELVENTDTTYTKLEFENTPVWDILKYIAESADKNGVIGFDFRVAPDGKFEFFTRNSKTSPISLTEKIEACEYRRDIHRIRNKIMIYGLADKSAPADKDAWTESLAPADGVWSAASGNSLSLDGTNRAKGAYSIKNERGTAAYCVSTFTLNSGKEVNANLYPDLGVFVAADKSYPVKVMLFDAAGRTAGYGNNLDKGLKVTANEWTFNELKVGRDYADQWSVEDGFDWTQIKKIEFQYFGFAAGGQILWVDGLYFGGCRYSAVREDTASQNAYGLRELTETDEELVTDAECDLRARALLDYFKDPAEYLTLRTTILDYGDSPLLPGDRVYVYLPNENVSAYYRIESVEYYVDARAQILEVTLELGRAPPLLADYLYGTRATTVTVEKLARTKLGKRALRAVGGGALGVHHAAHEVGDEAGYPWSESVGGWDKISGWIAPKYIGPYDDAATIVNFRTKNRAGTEILDHQFNPTDDGHGVLGSGTRKWKEINTVYLLLPTDGYMRIRTVGEANPKAQLSADMLQFGEGGASALDTWLKRVGEGQLELRFDLLPTVDNSGSIGNYEKAFAYVYAYTVNAGNVYPFENDTGDLGTEGTCWRHLWLSGYIKSLLGVDTNLLPSAENAWDLGSQTKKWSNLYVAGLGRLGWLNIGDYTVITPARALQNVTADAAIITSGQFPLARLPRGTSGYVLEAQGSAYDPMYVNPNGRYTPAGHNHAAGNITSGVLDEARIPTVFTALRTFNGGITMGAALNMNNQPIQNVATISQCMPPAANQGAVGTTSQYWNCIAGNSVWYKALGQFDMLDDLALIKKIRGNGKVDEKGVPLADPESLPPEITENGLINAGALMGLLIGAIKQLASRVEVIEELLEKTGGDVAA